MDTLFYLPASGKTYWSEELYANTGFSPNTDPGVLAVNGIYTVLQTPSPYDIQLYTYLPSYTVVGNYAEQSWVATPRPLPTAKGNGIVEEKTRAEGDLNLILYFNNVNTDIVSSVAGQDPIDRPATLQAVLTEMAVVTDTLGAQIDAINAATTVDEINNIVNPPTGIIQIYRTGATLEESVYNEFSSVTLTAADTELYIPGSATTVAYSGGSFPQTPAAFSPGDYLIQIRETATGFVITEFECPETETEISF